MNRPFRVRFCGCKVSHSFVGNASTRSLPRLVQRENSGRHRGVAGRLPEDRKLQMTDRELRLLDHELANFCDVNFKSKQPCQEMATWPFLKGSFLAKGFFF